MSLTLAAVSSDLFVKTINEFGALGRPFLFLVDFEMVKPEVFPLDEISPDRILYDINGNTNAIPIHAPASPIELKKFPPPFSLYRKSFESVWTSLRYGDSYLTNLTIRTRIETPLSLHDLFFSSHAKYKVWYDNQFLVFSPETFVRIENGVISSYPMKGTIDANVPDARETVLGNPKEMAEHVTIVDLIRNDLSGVASNVRVKRFRYVDEIRTSEKNLLQVSSEIAGELPSNYRATLGEIILKLLPAGSVSGAPKHKTVEIIRNAEGGPRGYYTGVVGVFDGSKLDSGVMIRFIENVDGTLYYRSGGGITVQSTADSEYQEAIDKIYVPLD